MFYEDNHSFISLLLKDILNSVVATNTVDVRKKDSLNNILQDSLRRLRIVTCCDGWHVNLNICFITIISYHYIINM